jgi:hypothetical protein
MSSTNVSWEDLKDGYTKQFIDRLMLASRVRRNNCASSEALAATHNQVSQRLKTDTSSASATSKKEWEEKSVSAWSERGVLIQDVKAKISKITGGATDGGGEDAARPAMFLRPHTTLRNRPKSSETSRLM